MKSIRTQNFRSFNDSGFIAIKPITIFVGLNSSGKSSFLRTLPLIRQSIEKKTSGPILWYGDFVDFGSFLETKSINSKKDIITFSFETEISTGVRHKNFPIQIHIGVTEDNDKNTQLTNFDICIGNISIQIITRHGKSKAINEGVYLNNDHLDEVYKNDDFVFGDNIIPQLTPAPRTGSLFTQSFFKRLDIFDDTKHFYNLLRKGNKRIETITKKIASILKPHFHLNTTEENIINNLEKLNFLPQTDLKKNLKAVFSSFKSFNANDLSYEKIQQISALLIIKDLDIILNQIDSKFRTFATAIRYIAPIRANAERYYRRQDLQVDEVDHTGANIPMVLRSLTANQKDRFEKWTEEHFGFIVRAYVSGGQYEIKIKKTNGQNFFNIADMGFGYSQMIPIIINLWFEIYLSKKKKIIFAIEQPELHLHPAFQALITDVMCKSIAIAKESKVDLRFIIETHSEPLVNQLGVHIENELISSEDAAIYVFEKDEHDNTTSVQRATFDKDGYLKNWPYGFFETRQ